MSKIQFLIAKFICKWGDFAGLGNDEDFLELKRLIKDYEGGLYKRKEMERDNK